jgi:alpha-L-fucosidase
MSSYKTVFVLTALLCFLSCSGPVQEKPTESAVPELERPDMTWFKEAKLGIFIHWGIYAVNGITESWSFFHDEISYEDYMAQMSGFTAESYDPDAWARLFREAGAKYSVLTTKHHDGVALWDTKLSDLSIPKQSPAGRDMIGPYVEGLRKEGLKVGLYFSHLDWSHPDYATVWPSNYTEEPENFNRYSYPEWGQDDPEAWQRFREFHHGQLKELSDLYKPDLFWFDGDWEREDEHWEMASLREDLREWNGDNVILNARMRGYGDYLTPEQAVPITRPEGIWEMCMTINHGWGYRIPDNQYKPIPEIIRIFTDILGKGGNLLLDIGPKPDGTIPEKQVITLKELGKWIGKHEEAVYKTVGGFPAGHFHGPTAYSQDSTTVYLYYWDSPTAELSLKGLRNEIKSVRVVGQEDSGELEYRRSGGADWKNIPGRLMITLPEELLDEYVTVIAVDLEGPLDAYYGGAH